MKNKIRRYIKYAVGIVFVFLLFLWPLLNMFSEAFIAKDEGFTFAYFANVLSDAGFAKVISNTLLINICSMVSAGIVGVLLAYVMAYTDIAFKNILHKLLLIPLFIPSYIVTLAWMQMCMKNGLLYQLTHFELYSYKGIILMFTVCQYPIVYLMCLSHFRRIPRELEQAAVVSGCGRVKAFFKVVLPITKITIVNAMLLVFLSCLDNFGIVAFLGIPANINVLSTDIYKTIVSSTKDSYNIAAVKGIVLSVLAVIMMLATQWLSGNNKAGNCEKEDMEPRIMLGKWKFVLAGIMSCFIGLFNIVPLIKLVSSALTKGQGVKLSLKTMCFDNFFKVLRNVKSMNGIKNSIFLALVAVLLCTVIGITISYLSEYKKDRIASGIQAVVTFPYSIPGIILGLAIILTYAGSFHGFTIYGTIWILLLSYVTRFTAVSLRYANSAFAQLDSSMDEAAQISGANNYVKWKKVIIPLSMGTISAGMGLVMIYSMMELTTSSLLWSGGTETIGVVIFNFTSAGLSNMASAYSSIIMIGVCAAALLLKVIDKSVRIIRRR